MSKFKNKKVTFEGVTFDSKKEFERYKILIIWQEVGLISDLRTQVAFELIGGEDSRREPKTPQRALCGGFCLCQRWGAGGGRCQKCHYTKG